MRLFQIKFTDGSYTQVEAVSFGAVEERFGIEAIHSIVVLEMRAV